MPGYFHAPRLRRAVCSPPGKLAARAWRNGRRRGLKNR
jgi:hypothetical protein